jgi:capsular exopolysaccharide synthesis family protein
MKSLHPLDSTYADLKKDEINFNLQRYFQAIWDNKWRIALFVASVLVAAYFVINSLQPQYRATATILIEQKDANVISVEELYGLDKQSEEYLATEFEVLRSRPLAEKVVDKLDLGNHPVFAASHDGKPTLAFLHSWKQKALALVGVESDEPANVDSQLVASEIARRELIKDYLERLNVNPLRDTQLVEVSFEAETPVLARDIANEHAQSYIEADLEARLERTQTAANWLAGQVDGLKDKLTTSERQLQEYTEQEGVIDIEGVTALSSQELNDLTTKLVDVRRTLSEARVRRAQVQSARRNGTLESLPSVQTDSVAQKLKLDVISASQIRAELGKRYGPQHPRMVSANSDLATAESALRGHIEKIVERVEFEFNAAQAEEAELQRSIASAKQNFFQTNRKESKYLELQREVEQNQNLFDLFYKRTKETTETIDLQSAHARILSAAEDPLQPSKPKKAMLFLLAALGSLVLSMLYYIMRELFNTGIRDGDDVDQRIGLPLLGSLPSIRNSFIRPAILNTQDDSERSKDGAIFKEAVNTVRTGLMLDRVDRPHKTIMVTSTIAGEGKSTIAGHLAYSYANVGRTLLIDCDLRTRGVSTMFGVNKTDMGLREVLSAEALLEQCVIGIDNNLDLLCANFTPLNPLKLISSPRFQAHIKEAAKKYNYVVLDAPPVLPVSDPMVLSGYVDAVIYAVRARSTPYHHISRCLTQLERVEAPVVGVVLNQLDMGGAYYSYYSYGNT